MERFNWSKRELLSKLWLLYKTKEDKSTLQPEKIMLIEILHQIILVIG